MAQGRTGTKRLVFLARWPSRRAAQHARDRLRELTARSRLLVPVEEVVGSLNRFLRGWAAVLQDRELGPRLRQGPVLRGRTTGDFRGQPASAKPTLGTTYGPLVI